MGAHHPSSVGDTALSPSSPGVAQGVFLEILAAFRISN